MAFIQDRFNVNIFILIVLTLVSLTSLVFVFENNFKEINNRYSVKVYELNKTFEKLVSAELKLNKSLEDLQLKGLKEDDLKTKYLSLKTVKDSLETQNTKLIKDLSDKNGQIVLLTDQLSFMNKTVTDLNRRIDLLRKENDCIRTNGTNC